MGNGYMYSFIFEIAKEENALFMDFELVSACFYFTTY